MKNKPVTIDQPDLISQLNEIATEGQNPNTLDIDLLDSLGILKKINDEDQNVADAVALVLPEIAQAVDNIVTAFNKGGRLIYIGAGTSGRLGILDAVECPPTFSVTDKYVLGIIAGGDQAIYKAVEGAEDNKVLAVEDLRKINLSCKDVLVGIAASGRTPYVLSAIEYAKQLGASTVGISCSPGQGLSVVADISICAVVGAEILTGSTRMKSGTAQKMILNMLSTASMIRIGKSFKNLMIDVNASNEKLYARAVKIVMQATECDYAEAKQALEKSHNNAKLASLLVLTGVTPEEGQALLQKNKGFLRKAIEDKY